MKFKHIYCFNSSGIEKFNRLFDGKFSNDPGRIKYKKKKTVSLDPDFSLLEDSKYVIPVENSSSFDTSQCKGTLSMIKSIVNALGGKNIALSMIDDREMMMWLTYALIDHITTQDEKGLYLIGAKSRYVPPYEGQPPREARRHLLVNRIRIHCEFDSDADFLLENVEPYIGGQIMEDFQFRAESYQRNILKLIKMLYDDPDTNSFKTGAAGGEGDIGDLFKFISQMSFVWCIESMQAEDIYNRLPSHFDRFK